MRVERIVILLGNMNFPSTKRAISQKTKESDDPTNKRKPFETLNTRGKYGVKNIGNKIRVQSTVINDAFINHKTCFDSFIINK